MTRLASKASLINLAGAAAIALTCAGWSAANEPSPGQQARDGNLKYTPQKARDGMTAPTPGDPQVLEKQGHPRAAAAAPELAACAGGTATACRAIEAGMAGGLWTWADGGITAMDDWETQEARKDAAKMTLKFKPEIRRRTAPVPVVVTTERVLAACDYGDVAACAAFAASVQQPVAAARDGRTYTAGR